MIFSLGLLASVSRSLDARRIASLVRIRSFSLLSLIASRSSAASAHLLADINSPAHLYLPAGFLSESAIIKVSFLSAALKALLTQMRIISQKFF